MLSATLRGNKQEAVYCATMDLVDVAKTILDNVLSEANLTVANIVDDRVIAIQNYKNNIKYSEYGW